TGFPFCDLDSGGSVTGVLGAIDTVLGQIPKDAKIIPGHGDVSSVDDLRKYRSSLEEMVNAVKKGLAAGKSADQLKKDKVLAAWRGRTSPSATSRGRRHRARASPRAVRPTSRGRRASRFATARASGWQEPT